MAATRSRGAAGLFAAALAVRLAFLLPGLAHPERLTIEEDSVEYLQLGRNLAPAPGFSQSTAPPYEPDVRRTPVYPAVLAAIFIAPGAGARAAAIAGVLISTLTVLAAARLAWAVAGPGAGWWAGALLSLDLTSAVYATQVLTEALFTLLLVLSFLPLLDHRQRRGNAATPRGAAWLSAIAAGALSG